MSQQMIETAKVVLADTFKFYLKAHNYHWNVEGQDFLQYHELFQKIYEETWEAVDDIAEQIRTMDHYVPGSFGRYNELSTLQDEREVPDSRTMIARLIMDNETVIKSIMQAYAEAEAAGNHGFSNLMAERQTAHRKHGWMLKSTVAR
jgi:starvation-inducible DNA-binding protein